jgi:exodeoxyribonuclease VII small subunit
MSTPSSYEAARAELAAIVKELEGGNLTLAQSLELWQQGERLTQMCLEWLDGASAAVGDAGALGEE